jgi:hypothetical protein
VHEDIDDPKYAHLLRTRAYLKSLPAGLASYPECVSKGQVWRNILQWTDTAQLAERVPSSVAILPDASVLAGAWIPAVHSFAGHLVLRDCLFPSDDAICAHFRQLDRKLFSGAAYRVMFALASPMMAVHAADRSFSAMFRGLRLTAHSTRSHHVELRLSYPSALLPSLVGRLYLVAFEVAVELAGGRSVNGRVLGHGVTEATYDISWK